MEMDVSTPARVAAAEQEFMQATIAENNGWSGYGLAAVLGQVRSGQVSMLATALSADHHRLRDIHRPCCIIR